MSSLTYHNYPGYGEWAAENFSYSQAVRIGKNTIHASGQGGWDPKTNDISNDISDDMKTEIEQAMSNVDLALRTAGGKGWDQVYKVRAYYVVGSKQSIPSEVTEVMVDAFKKWMPNHQPLWTWLGVAGLAIPSMRVEIEVEAYDPQS